MITMTIREALAIQAEQLDYYRDRYPHLEAAAIGATRALEIELPPLAVVALADGQDCPF